MAPPALAAADGTRRRRELRGRRALVTGSTSGIGLGIAARFAAAGANVMLNGFGDPGEIERIRRDLATHGTKVGYNGADMARPGEISALVADAAREFGAVDILVNNAGIQHVAPVQDFPPEQWERVIAVNLSAAFYATRAALPGMLTRNWGRIINIASVHGLVASVQKSAYVAAKHGLVGFTKVVALETAETGVTCNAVCPGWVLTPLVDKQIRARAEAEGVTYEHARLALVSEKQPSKEFVTPEQIAELALFLCGDAAAQIRGQAIAADGGWTAQ
ncbi:MAG: 3-hydroxybutyrate dehydrogenase [Betaproteobacteria bacterium]|nr:3-hydroxybutyrate dehydrogenase [Betaproteobacteria bacterium]